MSKPVVTIYDSSPDLKRPLKVLRDIFNGFIEGRELAWRLFLRQLRSTYRQTVLGVVWVFLPPIANTAIWVFLRSREVFDFGEATTEANEPFHATLYILVGMILWQSFVDSLLMPMDSINANRSMISKLNFPREALILQGLGELFFNLGIRLLLIVPAIFLFDGTFHYSVIVALPEIILLVLFAVGLGLMLVPIAALYHDIPRFLAIAFPFWMILTPIIYVLPNTFPGCLLNWLNPASPLLVGARDLIVTGATDHTLAMIVFSVIAIPVFVAGLVVFRVSIPALIERMVN